MGKRIGEIFFVIWTMAVFLGGYYLPHSPPRVLKSTAYHWDGYEIRFYDPGHGGALLEVYKGDQRLTWTILEEWGK